MQIYINNPTSATWIFGLILIIGLIVSSRWKKNQDLFPVSLTQELKGLAILAVIFSHIGYILATDNRFLFPLSIFAGIGVNLFLFLSGYGLTASALKKNSSIIKFYKSGLIKLFTPLWASLILFFLLDFFILKLNYSWQTIWQSFVGFFPNADVNSQLNSPLWYFTLILFYYLIFPIVWFKKYPWVSALILYGLGYWFIRFNPFWLVNVKHLYEVHVVAFPLGVAVAWLFSWPVFLAKLNLLKIDKIWLKKIGHYILLATLIIIICYTAYYSGVGKGPVLEQRLSLITMSAIVLLFLVKKIEFKLLYWLGFYSFEIYLLHWPILFRYDFLYRYLPTYPWLATAFYVIVFLFLGIGLRKLSNVVSKKINC
ncbi:MAG: acyltransferase family protein [Patescibacteria group bacterium]|jgi:peptidoglycan/LPS O-acetylase OafA/YrhL